ncbi:Protein HIDE1 [Camelus dromedarius]|uniref:Protein HIDE1 n=1 Tax=Camelus dromedarius TaxID=9838 RepID=A0A5N4CL38_CAMDR|nr:Protein HIDE1 [Camelus dromedarius]
MPWTVLLFAAGSLAIPAPSILLVPPHPSSQEDPIHISCVAPGDFRGANFTLYQGEQVVQLLQAPSDQLGVTFNLSGGSREAPRGPFRCQYGVLGEHRQPQLSNLSEPVHVSFPVPTWILALSLSLAGAFLLLAGLVVVAVVVRKVKVKQLQKKRASQNKTPAGDKSSPSPKCLCRERESCWAQINFATTDMSFDNTLFTISKMSLEEDAATLDGPSGSTVTPGNSGPRKRPTSTSSSPEPQEFITFRAC